MNGINHGNQCFDLLYVSVITSSRLPNSASSALPLSDRDSGNPIWCMVFQPAHSRSREFFFHEALKFVHNLSRFSRTDQQVNDQASEPKPTDRQEIAPDLLEEPQQTTGVSDP